MSYDIDLIDPETNQPVPVLSHTEGGTYAIDGIEIAGLNVTYNYSRLFHEELDPEAGIRWLYGKKASECISRLEHAVSILGTERAADYREPTPGNAGHALWVLLKWARENPGAVFRGD